MASAALLLLAGCGGAAAGPAASPSPPTSASVPARSATSATTPAATSAPPPAASAPTPKSTTSSEKNASFGVDKDAWPTTVAAAAPLLQALPKAFVGQPRQLYGNDKVNADGGPYAGVSYGDDVSLTVSEEYLSEDTPSGKAELLTANDLLAAAFNMGLTCAPRTYAGTAPSHGGGVGPAVTGKRSAKPVWFSCRIAGAEGNDNYTGQALGWTSGKTAWLIIGNNEAAVGSIVAALRTSR